MKLTCLLCRNRFYTHFVLQIKFCRILGMLAGHIVHRYMKKSCKTNICEIRTNGMYMHYDIIIFPTNFSICIFEIQVQISYSHPVKSYIDPIKLSEEENKKRVFHEHVFNV